MTRNCLNVIRKLASLAKVSYDVPIDEHMFDKWRATPAERNKYRYEFQHLPYDQRNTAVFEAIHKDRNRAKIQQHNTLINNRFNRAQSYSYYPLSEDPIPVDSRDYSNGQAQTVIPTSTQSTKQPTAPVNTQQPRQAINNIQQSQRSDMSYIPGFEGPRYKAPKSLDRIPASLRGTGGYLPGPLQ